MVEKVKKSRTKKTVEKEIPDNVSERKRSVNLESLDPERFEEISKFLGEECSKIIERTKKDCDKILNVYGLKLRPAFLILPLDFDENQLDKE